MKYKKGSFITVPNSDLLAGLHPTAQCLFMWLCHHANQDGVCFPSRKRLAGLCAISVDMVDKMMILLVSKELVIKTARKKDERINQTNFYEVLVGGVADTVGQVADTVGQGVADTVGPELNSDILTQTIELPTTQSAVADNKNLAELMHQFKDINPNIRFGHKTQRQAALDIINQVGFEQAMAITQFAISQQGKPYCPTITTPYQLREKMAQLRIYAERLKQPAKGGITILN